MKSLIVSALFPLSEEVVLTFVYEEAVRLAEKGVEVHVSRLAFGRDTLVDGMVVHNALDFGFLNALWQGLRHVSVFPRSLVFRPRHVVGISVFGGHIARIAKRNDVDIVHAHWAYPNGFASLIAKKIIDRPLVVTLHGYDILTEVSIGFGARLNKSFDSAIRKVLVGADKVVVASKRVYEEAMKAGCPKKNLMLIPMFVDVEQFNPQIDPFYVRDKLGLKDDPIVFCVRHHVAEKGIEFLIRTVPIVAKSFPNIKFIIGGDGPLLERHKLLASELDVSENVIFTGSISRKELPYYYAACNVSAVPSIVEAFGLVTVEAMACGKPVIGSNVGGIPDVIVDGVNGFLVKPRDVEGLAEKIIFLLNNLELAEKMGRRGRQIAEEKFSLEKRIEKIVQLYSQFA